MVLFGYRCIETPRKQGDSRCPVMGSGKGHRAWEDFWAVCGKGLQTPRSAINPIVGYLWVTFLRVSTHISGFR
jgi:hypothetical protein